jgi:hypothetical protein
MAVATRKWVSNEDELSMVIFCVQVMVDEVTHD